LKKEKKKAHSRSFFFLLQKKELSTWSKNRHGKFKAEFQLFGASNTYVQLRDDPSFFLFFFFSFFKGSWQRKFHEAAIW